MDGLLIVNKEKGYTSRDVVNIVSKVFNTSKIGHCGTLDPIAEGVLVIAIGKALKVIDLITTDSKEYIAEVKLGIETDTLDITGNVLKEMKNFKIEEKLVRNILDSFIGKSIQEVPLYSAVKVNGKRLYEYARENISVELPKREIEIFDIELLDFDNDRFIFRVCVSKGTYIRSLIRDIGNKLNIPATMINLKRIKQGVFSIDNSYTLENIKNGNYKVVPIIDALNDYEVVEVNDFIANKVTNGRILENRYKSEKIVFVDSNKNVLALYRPYEKDVAKIKPIKVL